MLKLFTKKDRNVWLFYLLTIFSNFWFISSNWIYFWTKYMTFGQLGLADGIGFAVALLLEIPTGAFGDLLGKKNTLFLSMLFSAFGVFIIATSSAYIPMFIGWIISQVGLALYSGTGEAFLYDSLKEKGKEKEYDKEISKIHMISIWTYSITAFLGGFLYYIWFRLPHLLWGTGYVLGLIITFYLQEPKIDTIKFSLRSYIFQLKMGFKELLQPKLQKYLVFTLFLSGVYFMYDWGFIKSAIATSFGFYSKEQGIILPVLLILTSILVNYVPSIRKRISDLYGLTILMLMLAAGFIAAYFKIGYLGFFVMLIITISGEISSPWISAVINKEVSSQYRATTLSTIALISKIPYVLLALIAGNAIQEGTFQKFNLITGIVLIIVSFVGLIIYFVKRNNQSKVSIAPEVK